MTPEQWRQIKGIAERAWDLPESERHGFVASESGDDDALRGEVESLLRSMADASALYEGEALAMPGAAAAFEQALWAGPSLEGSRVGPFRIIKEIGRGGMGSVYLAERAEGGFEQRVAIKFVGGMPTEVLLRRFHEERRILASLDHPNIARLIDGGTTADGLPYVVMEYVAGVGIQDFCDTHRLGVRARIELFRLVCSAVQYAHQHLVIHRDIKASNLLVTEDGAPKLLDFGIAKLVDPSGGAAHPALTFAPALTPESASPEQVRGDPVTVAADVYALGALLYRMVSGSGPYRAEESGSALMRAICDETPRPPSAALAASADPSLRKERIDRDLDLIVLKALRKEPERRYPTVEQFSDDLKRYLDGQPVLAAPDSRRYRTTKLLRRHQVAAAAASAALIAVLAGAGVAEYQARVARRERARAERRFGDVRRLTNSFLFEFHDAIADLPGSLNARQLVVRRAAEYLDGLAGEVRGDVALQRELATANERLGTILGGGGVSNLGDLRGAESRYQQALSIREALAARPGAEPADIQGLAQLRVQVARFLALKGDLVRAEESASHAVTLFQSLQERGEAPANQLGQLATAYQQLGYVQARRGKNAEALAALEAAVERATRQVGISPADLNETARLARIQIEYAEALLTARQPINALETLARAQRQYEQLLAADALNMRYRQNLVRIFNIQGAALDAVGDRPAMIRAFTQAVDTADGMLAASPDDHGSKLAALLSHSALGRALVRTGETEAGIDRLRQTIAEAESIATASPGDDFTVNELAVARLNLGETLLTAQHGLEGCREIGEGLRLWNALAERTGVPGEVAGYRGHFEDLLATCRRPEPPSSSR
jgi:non-specific serine/threonine protein kinase/serine/threonine-protein kinase